MPKFQKRHYETLAATLKSLRSHTYNGKLHLTTVVKEISLVLQRDNPRFDKDKFYKASDYNDEWDT